MQNDRVSGANENPNFDGNTILLEKEDNDYVYISESKNAKFKTNDRIIDYISLMGNNMCPYTFAIGTNIHILYQFISNLWKMIKLKKAFFKCDKQ